MGHKSDTALKPNVAMRRYGIKTISQRLTGLDMVTNPILEPTVRYDPRTELWILVEPYAVIIDGFTFSPTIGFRFRASIPEWLWGVVDPEELSHRAALIHDWLYHHAGNVPELDIEISRKCADLIFYKIMKEMCVTWWKRDLAYRAVRWFSKRSWNKRADL
jgi:hypothetical protein